MKLYYKGKIEEAPNEGKYHVRSFIDMHSDGVRYLHKAHFARAIKNGESVWIWHHTTTENWDKISEEVQQRQLKYIMRDIG